MKYKRIVVSRYGGTEVLQVIEDELPQPQPDEVRIKILTAGVAWGDILKREGWAGRGVQPPFTPGYDLVGLVDKPGENVTTLQSGQMVAALSMVGGYAEFICLPASELVQVPAGVDPVQAVCLVMNYGINSADYSSPQWCREDLSRLFDLLVHGKIKPIIARVLPLIEAAQAHQLLGANSTTGKLVLICNPYE